MTRNARNLAANQRPNLCLAPPISFHSNKFVGFVFRQALEDNKHVQKQQAWRNSLNQQTPEQSLMIEVTQGNTDALAQLYDLFAAKMLGLAHRVLGNRRDAEDLIHDVFYEVWNKASHYNAKRGSVQSWLLIKTRSRALDRLRKLQTAHKYALLAAQEDSTQHQEVPSDKNEPDHQRTVHAINNLPLPQRQVIELKYFTGMSLAEIAEQYSTPIGTIKSRLSNALAKLRAELGPGELYDAQI